MDIVNDLIRAGKRFDARGWVLGTSGNFSAVLSRDPLRRAITLGGNAAAPRDRRDARRRRGAAHALDLEYVPVRPAARRVRHLRLRDAEGAVGRAHAPAPRVGAGRGERPGHGTAGAGGAAGARREQLPRVPHPSARVVHLGSLAAGSGPARRDTGVSAGNGRAGALQLPDARGGRTMALVNIPEQHTTL